VGNKVTHLGMSGHLAVMSELLRLGYNVAIPYVDVGEDIYVFDDRRGGELIAHVQVKTATAEVDADGGVKGQYNNVRKDQLKKPRAISLYYVFALLTAEQGWDFIVMKREELQEIRAAFDRKKAKEPASDAYGMHIQYTPEDARVWDSSLQSYRGRALFVRHFPKVTTGAGARGES
jgi:hypothetical protein